MKNKLKQKHIDFLESSNYYGQNYYLLIYRIIISNMSLEEDLGDPTNAKNLIRVSDSLEAFRKLMDSTGELTEQMIIDTANTINKNKHYNPYIGFGYRKFGGKGMCGNPDIPISLPNEIEHDMKMLLYRYNVEWANLDPFEREALFNIEFLRIHPFEDGNGRTSRLILNFNMLRQGYAPIILTGEDRDRYFQARNEEDVKYIKSLFIRKSSEELEAIEELMIDKNFEVEEVGHAKYKHK